MQTGCTEQNAAAAVWDGSDDNGIDAVYFDPSDPRVVIVQSKWFTEGAGEPKATDISVFADGIRDLVESNAENFATRLQTRVAEAEQALMTPGVTLECVVVSTGKSSLSKHSNAHISCVLKELNDVGDLEPIATQVVLGLTEVYNSLASSSTTERIKILANLSEWSSITQPYPAYFGIIDGLQLKEWWKKNGKRLVARNIRHSLGATDVNNGIRTTATNVPENFWYFNNGITLIADEALRAPKSAASRSPGLFEFKGASIVNGAQTVSTLARIESDECLGKVRVPIRVIVLDGAPENLGGEITRANNLQNRVEARDFVAQAPLQLRLKKEMSMEGVEYQFVRSDDFVASDRSCDLVEMTTALACATGDPAMAVQVKTGIGRFFGDIKRAPYKTIYNPKLNGARAFNAVLVQREIDKWIERKRPSIAKKSGYSWGTLIHGNRVLAAGVFKILGDGAIQLPIDDLQKKMGGLGIDAICDRLYVGMVDALNEQFPGRFLAVLFKNPAMSKVVFESATKGKKA